MFVFIGNIVIYLGHIESLIPDYLAL